MAFAVYTAWGNDYDGQLWLVRIIMQIMQKVHRWVWTNSSVPMSAIVLARVGQSRTTLAALTVTASIKAAKQER